MPHAALLRCRLLSYVVNEGGDRFGAFYWSRLLFVFCLPFPFPFLDREASRV